MSALHDALAEYLATRRALGTQLKWPEMSLRKFVDFIEAEGAGFVTTELATRWAFQPVGVQRATHARRREIVRAFAVWLQATDTRTQVPPRGLLPARHRRPAPHIYSDREIADLMTAAGQLHSASGVRGATFKTLIGLLAATGLRPGEARKLDVSDVDLSAGVALPSASRSSASPALSRWSGRPRPPWWPTQRSAMQLGFARRHRRSSSRRADRAWRGVWFGAPSPTFARPSACALGSIAASDAVLASRTFATRLPREGSSSGTAPASTWTGSCHVSSRTSVTSASSRPIGTSRRFPSSCASRPNARRCPPGETHDEPGESPGPPPALFHRPPPSAARCEPSYRRFLPRHFPTAAPLRVEAPGAGAIASARGGPRRGAPRRLPRSSRARPCQHGEDPQHSSRRRSRVLSIRRVHRTGVLPSKPAGSRDPEQAPRAPAGPNSLPKRRPPPSSPPRTRSRGSGVATAPCCMWQYRPACAMRNSAPSNEATWISVLAHTFGAAERGARHAALPCGVMSPPCSKHGSSIKLRRRTIPCSQAHAAGP